MKVLDELGSKASGHAVHLPPNKSLSCSRTGTCSATTATCWKYEGENGHSFPDCAPPLLRGVTACNRSGKSKTISSLRKFRSLCWTLSKINGSLYFNHNSKHFQCYLKGCFYLPVTVPEYNLLNDYGEILPDGQDKKKRLWACFFLGSRKISGPPPHSRTASHPARLCKVLSRLASHVTPIFTPPEARVPGEFPQEGKWRLGKMLCRIDVQEALSRSSSSPKWDHWPSMAPTASAAESEPPKKLFGLNSFLGPTLSNSDLNMGFGQGGDETQPQSVFLTGLPGDCQAGNPQDPWS